MAENEFCKDFEHCFKFYEKAIEGRNFHYKNYNTWANYYAIFTGALFIGYYNIYGKNSFYLPLIIVLVGLIISVCWHLTVKGHYNWMLSWIKIVHQYEKELSKISKKNNLKEWKVYSVYFNSDSNIYQKNISSQKLTSLFTIFVEIAWSVIAIFDMHKFIIILLKRLHYYQCCCKNFVIMFSIIVIVLINVFAYLVFDKNSNVSEMEHSIC